MAQGNDNQMKVKIPWWKVDIGDHEAAKVLTSIRAKCISQGPVTEKFEQQIAEELGVPFVVACTSGSTALLMALIAAGIGPGDEVIVPNRTWIATAHAVMVLGAKVVLADDDGFEKSIFISDVQKKINWKTRAIIPVHLNGRAADVETCKVIAAKKNCVVIEDAAQAFLSKNLEGNLGTQSLVGCFSFSLTKLISTGQGGAVCTADKSIWKKLRALRNHGVDDPVKIKYSGFGFNFRFNDILASIGIGQLHKIKKSISHLIKVHSLYKKELQNLPELNFIPADLKNGELPLYAEVLCKKRALIINELAKKGIQTRPYYPNLSLAPQFKTDKRFPFSKKHSLESLFLPCGPSQPIENIMRTINELKSICEKI